MKKLSTLLLIISCSLCFSQKYHFDYAVQYDHETTNGKMYLQNVINSADESYDLRLTSTKKNVTAVLIDYKNSVQHFFTLSSLKFPLTTEHFKYLYSKKMPSLVKQFAEEDARRFFDVELIESKNEISIYSVKEYGSSLKKKPTTTGIIKMKNFENQLSSFGLSNLLDYVNAGKKINFSTNQILTEGEIKFKGGEHKMKLVYVEPQDFDLNIAKIVYK